MYLSNTHNWKVNCSIIQEVLINCIYNNNIFNLINNFILIMMMIFKFNRLIILYYTAYVSLYSM